MSISMLPTTSTKFPFRIWEMVLFSAVAVFGSIGNSLVIAVVVFNRKYRRIPFNVYLGGLALADLSLTLFGPMYYLLQTPVFQTENKTLGTVVCKFVHFFSGWMMIWSCYMLTVISVERYIAILYPIYSRTHASGRKARRIIALALFFSMLTNIPDAYSGKFVSPASSSCKVGNACTYIWENKTTEKVVYLFAFIFQCAIPLGIFVFVFLNIWINLLKQERMLKQTYGLSLSPTAIQQIVQRRLKSAKTIGIMILVFILCWMPDRIVFVLFQYSHMTAITWDSPLYQGFLILIFFSSAVNPFIITLRSKKLRIALAGMISKLFPAKYHMHSAKQIRGRKRRYQKLAKVQ